MACNWSVRINIVLQGMTIDKVPILGELFLLKLV